MLCDFGSRGRLVSAERSPKQMLNWSGSAAALYAGGGWQQFYERVFKKPLKQKSCVERRHSITCWNITRIFLFFTMKPKRSCEFLVFLCRNALPVTIKFSPSSTLIMQGTASAVWSEVTKHQHVSTNFYFFCCAPPGRLLYSETFLLLSDVSKTRVLS